MVSDLPGETGRLASGATLSVHVAEGDDRFGEMPPPDGWGLTATMNGDRWRAVVQPAAQDPDGGWTLELEVQGRYQEDQR